MAWPREPAAMESEFTPAGFEAVKARAYTEWYVGARQELERCTVLSDRFGEMREVRIMLAYQAEMAAPGMHPYMVEDVAFVDAPGSEPLDERQRACLDRLRGDRLDIMAAFTEIPPSHHHIMTTDYMPIP